MSSLVELRKALGVTQDKSQVMSVVSIDNGKARLEANGAVVFVSGSWAVGTRLVVKAGNVISVVAQTNMVFYSE